ncbi:MAG: carbohydrate-binding protein [Bacteroidota bacterium]
MKTRVLLLAFVMAFSLVLTNALYAQWTVTTQLDLHIPTPDQVEMGDEYPRIIQLKNGDLLATFEWFRPNGQAPRFLFYRSTDGGKTWAFDNDLRDGLGHPVQHMWQPELYELPVQSGNLPAGTLLFSGNVRDGGASHIALWKSNDNGHTWQYLSQLVHGRFWEPNLIVSPTGQLICYISDEGDPSHSQKLIYMVSNDGGRTWGPITNFVASPIFGHRPGMPRTVRMGNGRYIVVYEGIDVDPANSIHFKLSDDGLNWGNVNTIGTSIRSTDGHIPGGAPSVTWTPEGGPNGTVIVTSCGQDPMVSRGTDNFVNYNYGVGPWYRVQQPLAYRFVYRPGYSRSVAVANQGKSILHINCLDFGPRGRDGGFGPDFTRCKISFASTPTTIERGLQYKLVNRNSWLTLGLTAFGTADGTKTNQFTDTYDDMQHWRIDDAGGGFIKLVNVLANKALTASVNTNDVIITGGANDAQLWQLISDGNNANGFYRLKNKATGKFLEIPNGSTTADVPVGQWTDLPGAAQEWNIQYVNGYAGLDSKVIVTKSPFPGPNPTVIPGVVEAENFDNGSEGISYHDTTPTNLIGPFRSNTAVDTEPCSEGGHNIAFSDNGEWLEYTVNVTAAGPYTFDSRVSSPFTTGSFHIEMDGTNVTGALAVPNTTGWQTWTNVSKTVNLTAGQHVMRFVIDTKEFNINKFTFTNQSNPQVQTPYPGPTAAAIPGVVEAENFDNGGEGVAYHDTEETNFGGVGSRLGPDVFTVSEGTNGIGWINTGEWLEYTVNAATAGSYNINARVASVFATGVFHLEWDGVNVSNAIAVPNTGDWQTWQSVTKTVTLTAGQHVLRVFADAGNFNINKITFASAATAGDGLNAQYFNGQNFNTPALTRKDANINFNWGGGSPALERVGVDNFSVRWTGQLLPRNTGTYTFHMTSDNGRRVWVNNVLIIDKWVDDWAIEYTGTINLTAGQKVNIKVEYFENVGGADAKLEWSGAGQTREVIPQSQLFSSSSARQALAEIAQDVAVQLEVFPNPAESVIHIRRQLEQATPVNIQLLDVLAQPIMGLSEMAPAGLYETELNTTSTKPGMYILKVQMGKQLVTRKVIIKK